MDAPAGNNSMFLREISVTSGVMRRLVLNAPLKTLCEIYNRSSEVDALIHETLADRVAALLKLYVFDVFEFREMLRVSRSVVSGSSLLKLFDLIRAWLQGDLDIYVPLDGAATVEAYLVGEGYILSNSYDVTDTPPEYQNAGIRFIHTYTRGDRRIQAIISNGSDSILPITSFWATTLFSVLTADRLVIAYPNDVFNRVGRIMPNWVDVPHVTNLQTKYRKRGYEIVNGQAYTGNAPRMRYFGDRECVILGYGKLEQDGLDDLIPILNPALTWKEIV